MKTILLFSTLLFGFFFNAEAQKKQKGPSSDAVTDSVRFNELADMYYQSKYWNVYIPRWIEIDSTRIGISAHLETIVENFFCKEKPDPFYIKVCNYDFSSLQCLKPHDFSPVLWGKIKEEYQKELCGEEK